MVKLIGMGDIVRLGDKIDKLWVFGGSGQTGLRKN
jgi:hypothetical protein